MKPADKFQIIPAAVRLAQAARHGVLYVSHRPVPDGEREFQT